MTVHLSMACGEYDLTSPIDRGEVSAKGIDLTVMNYASPDRHWRMGRHQEFDVAEYAVGSYLASRPWPDEYPFTAIPVFPHRRFRHSYMVKHADADIEDPGDLAGKDVGLKHWQNSAGLWMRGICAEHYGLDLTDVDWHFETAVGNVSRYEPPDRYSVERLAPDEDVEGLVATGELDAALFPATLGAVKTEGTGVERIFEDPTAVERSYYEETGIFPVMHVVVVKDRVLEEHPWVAQNLVDLFDDALEVALDKLEDPRWTAFAFARQTLEDQQALMGVNPYEYGLDRNRVALEKLLDYALDQGLIPRRYDWDELFVPSTLDRAELERLEAQGAAIQRRPD